jgi:hypothetical protein
MHSAATKKWVLLPLLAIVFSAVFFGLPEWQPEPDERSAATPPNQSAQSRGADGKESQVRNNPPPPKPQPLSQHIVEYHIQVELDAENKRLIGRQTLTWKHPGSQPVKELYFHMYPNAFRSMESTFNRESGGKLRNDRMGEDNFGSIRLTALTTSDGIDLNRRTSFVQPDDGNEQDQTLMRVQLIQPVQAGSEITLNMSFEVQLPRVYARMGYAGDFVMAGQWFPKLAVYEPKGRRGAETEGWNLHQYHGNSEFYADFGIYSVQIKVPENYIVAATGFPIKPAVKYGGKKTYQFYADDVHDFAWAASPDFVYVEKEYATARIPGLKIKLYLDPAHAPLEERYLQAVKRSLDEYARWFGTYPYSTLSVVVPPAGAGGAAGMEYPTLITAWAADEADPGNDLERVVAHEIGHQYFYGMVANNEFEEAWLDEGFTSYAEDKVMETVYGIAPPLTIESSYITSPQPLAKASWDYPNHRVYAENVYIRAKLVLYGIERTIGEETMRKVMRTYFGKYRFKHPTTADFLQVLEQVTNRSWDDYFDQFVYDGRMVDYAIRSIRSVPVRLDSGEAYENRIVVESRDGIHGSADILIHFQDGTNAKQTWDGRKGETEFKIVSRSPVAWALIDPERTIVLENRHINNFMKTEVDERQKIRLNVGITKLIEGLIQWFAW